SRLLTPRLLASIPPHPAPPRLDSSSIHPSSQRLKKGCLSLRRPFWYLEPAQPRLLLSRRHGSLVLLCSTSASASRLPFLTPPRCRGCAPCARSGCARAPLLASRRGGAAAACGARRPGARGRGGCQVVWHLD